MILHGRRAFWLTSIVVAMLVGEGMRTRWRRVVALMTARAAPTAWPCAQISGKHAPI